MIRRIAVPALLLTVVAACGGGEISIAEYVDEVNRVTQAPNARAAELNVQAVADPTPQQIQTFLEQMYAEVRIPIRAAAEGIEPPPQIADLHELVVDWHNQFIAIEQGLALRFGTTPDTAEGWAELSDSPEVIAYRASIAKGKQLCADLHAAINERAEQGVFADTPWLPDELSETVRRMLLCDGFPENPQAVYRYP